MAVVDINNEEEVKLQIVIPWLEGLGYKRDAMEFNKTISVQEGLKKKSIFADIVIYADKNKYTPLVVVDTKSPTEVLTKQDRDQVISYARLLPQIAPLAILTNGSINQIYQTIDKSRIKDLPNKKILLRDFVNAVISNNIQKALRQEATNELFIIDDVNTFKDLLKRCHNTIRNNEGYDPTQAFDEMSKVLFAKMYEEQKHKENNRFTLETFDKTLQDLNVNIVQQQFSEIQKAEGFKDLFPANTKIELRDRTIREIVTTFEKYDLTLTKFDVKGEAYEYFLSDTFTGALGDFFTPRNVVEFIVEAINPKIGEKIIDPFCGTGGFLIYAFDTVSEKIRIQDFSDKEKERWKLELSSRSLYGIDWGKRTAQACKMNMIVHGDGNTGIFQANGFSNVPDIIEENSFDICLTNPPFGAQETDTTILQNYDLGSGRPSQKREILAVERCIKLVKPKTGIVAIILPDGILNNDTSSYVREFINREADLLAVVGLNKETFEGYNATAKTSILILQRKEKPEAKRSHEVFMAVCLNSGYAPTGQQIPGNQLPDILFDLNNYRQSKDFDQIYEYCSVVTIENPSDRIDAERYIAVSKHLKGNPVAVSEDLFQKMNDLAEVSLQIKTSLQRIYSVEEFEYIPISDFIKPAINKVSVKHANHYASLGVSGNGLGVFKKDSKSGSEISSKYLNCSKEGWLVYSRLFAKNGSFAYITKDTEGFYLSNEFPTFEVIDTRYNREELLEYLVFYLSSPQMINYIERLTTGSTKESRGRFKENQLLAVKIPLPVKDLVFKEIVASIRLIKGFQAEIRELSSHIKNLPKSFQLSLPEVVDKKQDSKKNGLSDTQLVAKYESGKVQMKKIMKGILTTPPPNEKKEVNKISWIDCYFFNGACLSYTNAQRHFKYSEIAAESKDYGFSISLIVLGMEELIKSLLLICLNGNDNFINHEQKTRLFKSHEIKQVNIKDFLSALTVFSIGEYEENAISYLELTDSTKFKRPAYFLSKALRLGEITEEEIDELTAILDKANYYKNVGFYVDVSIQGDFKSPEDIKEDTYNNFKRLSDVLKRFVAPIFEMPLSDERILDFLDDSNWHYF